MIQLGLSAAIDGQVMRDMNMWSTVHGGLMPARLRRKKPAERDGHGSLSSNMGRREEWAPERGRLIR